MHFLFDRRGCDFCRTFSAIDPKLLHAGEPCPHDDNYWRNFCLFHSRYYAKKLGGTPSRLCFADKLSCTLTPRWLYLPLANASGEIHEYLQKSEKADSAHWSPTGLDQKVWHAQLCSYMRAWVDEHKDGRADNWTNAKRNDGV